jgi:hypothetical protein
MRILLIVAATLFVLTGHCTACAGEKHMNSALEKREAQVKQKIGFDNLLNSIDANRGIVANWLDFHAFLPPEEKGWTAIHDEVDFTELAGLVEHQILFNKGESQLEIQVFVSSHGPRAALQRLIDTMLATSMWPDPYQPGPADIGQLCLLLPTANPTVLVINYNVYLVISVYDYNMDIVTLARTITKYMNEHLSPLADHAPRFAATKVDPSHPRVGAAFNIDVTLPPAIDPNRILWKLSSAIDSDIIDQREITQNRLVLTVSKNGAIEIPLWIADRNTLLSSETRVRIDIQP